MEITNTRVSSTARSNETARPYLMIIAGARVGELHTLTGARTIVGRSPEAGLRIDDMGISREHAELRVDGGLLTFRDLGSTNGTFLNGERAETRELRAGDKLSIGAATLLIFTHADGLESNYQRGRFLNAVRDPATAALKREVFIERLREEVSFTRRHGAPLAVIAWELDGFTALEDRLGLPAAQQTLGAVARAVSESLPDDDVIALLGPGQFVVACRETDLHAASDRAARLRAAVSAVEVDDAGSRPSLTASVGVAVCGPGPGAGAEKSSSAAEALLRNARAALSAARARGGDRVEIDATSFVPQDR